MDAKLQMISINAIFFQPLVAQICVLICVSKWSEYKLISSRFKNCCFSVSFKRDIDFQDEMRSKYNIRVRSGTKVCSEHFEEEDFKSSQKDELRD